MRPTPVLFRVFLSDGRVLSSDGEWARLDDRVIFSMPAQLTRDPVELHLVTIPSQRVDWPRTEAYAESVRAAAYVANRGDADFALFSTEVAKVLNDVAKSRILRPGSPPRSGRGRSSRTGRPRITATASGKCATRLRCSTR